ncbi:MAG: hypothetical protein R3E44_00520 [Paracoccaceae bacterium]
MGQSRITIAVIATLASQIPSAALPQQVGAVPVSTVPPQVGVVPVTPAIPVVPAPRPSFRYPQSGKMTNTGGFQVDLGLSSSVTVDDNFALDPVSLGTSTIFDNTLSLGISSITGIQDLQIDATGVLRYADLPGGTLSGFEDPTLRFTYTRTGINSRLTMTGLYRDVDRSFLDPFAILQQQQNTGTLSTNGGTQQNRQLGLYYETGINDPLGFRFNLNHDRVAYQNVTDPNLFDNETNQAAVTMTMKVSPVTMFDFNAGITDYTAADNVRTDRRTKDYSVGVVHDFDQVWVLDAQIGLTEIDETTVFGKTKDTGTTGSVRLTRTMVNGTAFASYDTTLNQNGKISTVRVGRDLTLPRGSVLAEIGATKTPNGQNHVIGRLAYAHQLKSGRLDIAADRNVYTNGVNDDILDTTVSLGYTHNIDAISDLNFTADWTRSESAGIGNAATIVQSALRAAYTRQLTPDWSLTGGAVIREQTDSSVVGKANSNSVFVTLDRTFSFRP